jgi:ribosomal protein L11 methyltransferase
MILSLTPRVVVHDVATPYAAPPGVIALATYPSAAFGDGTHPTTRLCARALDLRCRLQRPARVLDVGTGNGVLARLARAHGVPFVVGTDIDEASLQAARNNAALDAYGGTLTFSNDAPDPFGTFDVVIANILEGVLLALAPALVRAVAPGGELWLSGFMPPQTPSLRAAFSARGLVVVETYHLDGWCLLQLRAP